MTDFALDTTTNDLDISTGDLRFVTGADAVAQHLLVRLRLFQGEWFYDLRVGIPYYEQILLKNPNLVAITGIFRQAIASTPGVDELQRIDLDFDRSARALSLNFTAQLEGEDVARDFSEVFIL